MGRARDGVESGQRLRQAVGQLAVTDGTSCGGKNGKERGGRTRTGKTALGGGGKAKACLYRCGIEVCKSGGAGNGVEGG